MQHVCIGDVYLEAVSQDQPAEGNRILTAGSCGSAMRPLPSLPDGVQVCHILRR